MKNYYTTENNFYGNTSPNELLEKYGSPLYVYNESILRARCREMMSLISYPRFEVNYSIKANSNIHLLRIIQEEGLHADAISPGEIFILLAASFKPHEIFYISNNVSEEEMLFAIQRKITVSVDSISQLKQFGKINPGGTVAIRFNSGIGAGHNEKVITGGNNTKFGIHPESIPEVKDILQKYRLTLLGINQHIGSLFMEPAPYITAAKYLLSIAENFNNLEFIDFGGGFGIPYHKQYGEKRLDLDALGQNLTLLVNQWTTKQKNQPIFKIEPGRYITAECGVLLGRIYSIKQNHNTTYVGTDLGFNVLARPVMYNSYHDVEVYRNDEPLEKHHCHRTFTIVGNICESGDIIAKNRLLPNIEKGDIVGIMDTGAYGFSMSSNYNNRLRPAEVLVTENGKDILIRRRDTYSDLLRNFEMEFLDNSPDNNIQKVPHVL